MAFIAFGKPEIAKKIKIFFALSPVATLGHITSGIKYLAPISKEFEVLVFSRGILKITCKCTVDKC